MSSDQSGAVSIHAQVCFLRNCLGAMEETLEVTRRRVRLDPLWPVQQFFLGLAPLNLSDPSAAIDPIREAIPHSLSCRLGGFAQAAEKAPLHYSN